MRDVVVATLAVVLGWGVGVTTSNRVNTAAVMAYASSLDIERKAAYQALLAKERAAVKIQQAQAQAVVQEERAAAQRERVQEQAAARAERAALEQKLVAYTAACAKQFQTVQRWRGQLQHLFAATDPPRP